MLDVLFTNEDTQRLKGLADLFGLSLDQVHEKIAAHMLEAGDILGTNKPDETGEPRNGEPD